MNGQVAHIWLSILQQGLGADTTLELLKKYPAAGNLQLAAAPKLNSEVCSVLSEQHRERDRRMFNLQEQTGAALTAVGKALTMLLQGNGAESTRPLIEMLSDAGRLLADTHHEQSQCRRTLASADVGNQFRATLTDVAVDGWLFGSNLGERVKAARELEKISSELKSRPSTSTGAPLNSRGLPRAAYRGYRGRPETTQKHYSYREAAPRRGHKRVTKQFYPSPKPRGPRRAEAKHQ